MWQDNLFLQKAKNKPIYSRIIKSFLRSLTHYMLAIKKSRSPMRSPQQKVLKTKPNETLSRLIKRFTLAILFFSGTSEYLIENEGKNSKLCSINFLKIKFQFYVPTLISWYCIVCKVQHKRIVA